MYIDRSLQMSSFSSFRNYFESGTIYRFYSGMLAITPNSLYRPSYLFQCRWKQISLHTINATEINAYYKLQMILNCLETISIIKSQTLTCSSIMPSSIIAYFCFFNFCFQKQLSCVFSIFVSFLSSVSNKSQLCRVKSSTIDLSCYFYTSLILLFIILFQKSLFMIKNYLSSHKLKFKMYNNN